MERDIQIGSLLRGTLGKEDGILGLVIDVDPYGFVTLQIVGENRKCTIHRHDAGFNWEVVV